MIAQGFGITQDRPAAHLLLVRPNVRVPGCVVCHHDVIRIFGKGPKRAKTYGIGLEETVEKSTVLGISIASGDVLSLFKSRHCCVGGSSWPRARVAR